MVIFDSKLLVYQRVTCPAKFCPERSVLFPILFCVRQTNLGAKSIADIVNMYVFPTHEKHLANSNSKQPANVVQCSFCWCALIPAICLIIDVCHGGHVGVVHAKFNFLNFFHLAVRLLGGRNDKVGPQVRKEFGGFKWQNEFDVSTINPTVLGVTNQLSYLRGPHLLGEGFSFGPPISSVAWSPDGLTKNRYPQIQWFMFYHLLPLNFCQNQAPFLKWCFIMFYHLMSPILQTNFPNTRGGSLYKIDDTSFVIWFLD